MPEIQNLGAEQRFAVRAINGTYIVNLRRIWCHCATDNAYPTTGTYFGHLNRYLLQVPFGTGKKNPGETGCVPDPPESRNSIYFEMTR
jgi:hypothetical protein